MVDPQAAPVVARAEDLLSVRAAPVVRAVAVPADRQVVPVVARQAGSCIMLRLDTGPPMVRLLFLCRALFLSRHSRYRLLP